MSETSSSPARASSEAVLNSQLFLPVVFTSTDTPPPAREIPIINIPGFTGEIQSEQAAIFWFGKVTPTANYADVRIGYNDTTLWVSISVFDRRLWYDPQPSTADLTQWDSTSLFIDPNAGAGANGVIRLDAQMNWWEDRPPFQAAYQGGPAGWQLASTNFTTYTNWWGFPQPNDNQDDRAWMVIYSIPFRSLGLNDKPAAGSVWRLGVKVHDRDDSTGTAIADQSWPTEMDSTHPTTWGQIRFGGLPAYFVPSHSPPEQTISIRNGLNGGVVQDGMVGGNTTCGDGLEFWSEWGSKSYPGARDINVQTQGNTDDWPCFSKVYITIPLAQLPPSKVIVSSTLRLYQSGNATGFSYDPPKALNSLIQAFVVSETWTPASLSWNTAPPPLENVSQAWVSSISMSDLGIARGWDVSRAVAQSYASNQPLRLVLYSADYYGPHGKYFFSSNSSDNNGAFRPQLNVVIANP